MSEYIEEIVTVEVLQSGELRLILGSGGRAMYQHIYREARGVNWDKEAGAFMGTERKKWSYAQWFAHIVKVCGCVGIDLRLSPEAQWIDVPESDKNCILALNPRS